MAPAKKQNKEVEHLRKLINSLSFEIGKLTVEIANLQLYIDDLKNEKTIIDQ